MQKGRKYNTFARNSLPPAAVLLSRRFAVSIFVRCAHQRSRWGPTVSVSDLHTHGRLWWRTPSRYVYVIPPRWRQGDVPQRNLRVGLAWRHRPISGPGGKRITAIGPSGVGRLVATLANCYDRSRCLSPGPPHSHPRTTQILCSTRKMLPSRGAGIYGFVQGRQKRYICKIGAVRNGHQHFQHI